MAYYVIIRGPLGCGKTTIAKEICARIGAKYFSVDEILSTHDLENDREEGYISQKSFIKANDILVKLAKPFLEKGMNVIFDGNFYWKSQIEDLQKKLKFGGQVFTLKATLNLCITRDKNREKTLGVGAASVVYTKSTEFDYGNLVDVSQPIEKCVREIIEQLPK